MTGVLFDLAGLKTVERHICEAEIRTRCRSQYLGDYEILCRCLGRYSMFLDTRDVGFASHILMDGFWEYWVTRFMVEIIQPDFRVLDIGANFGYYSLLLSDLVGSNGFCLAVEPNPQVARKLKKNLAINGFASRSKVLALALGRELFWLRIFFCSSRRAKERLRCDARFCCAWRHEWPYRTS